MSNLQAEAPSPESPRQKQKKRRPTAKQEEYRQAMKQRMTELAQAGLSGADRMRQAAAEGRAGQLARPSVLP